MRTVRAVYRQFFLDLFGNAAILCQVKWPWMLLLCAINWPFWCQAMPDAGSVINDPVKPKVRLEKGKTIGHLQDQRLNEVSGIAAASDGSGHLWMINDGGSDAILYRVNTQGRVVQFFEVAKNTNRDWEDMAIFTWRNQSFLLIADVGDNDADRAHIKLLVLAEPSLNKTRKLDLPAKQLLPWNVQRYRYPQGPQDCEAIAVDLLADKIYLLAKRTQPAQLFSLSLSQLMVPSSSTPSELPLVMETELASLSRPVSDPLIRSFLRFVANWPTAMSIDASQQQAVILTYGFLYFYQRKPNQSWPQALAQPFAVQVLSQLAQPESVTFTQQDQVLVVSEGLGSRMVSWQRPTPE